MVLKREDDKNNYKTLFYGRNEFVNSSNLCNICNRILLMTV